MTILAAVQAVPELFTQAICYGLYVSTFPTCLRWLLCENEDWKLRPYKQMKWLYITISVLIFIIATADITIAVRLTRARLFGELLIADQLSWISTAIEGTTMIIIDAVLIYRCWTVYNKSWRVVLLPLVFWTGTIACAVTWIVCDTVGNLELSNSPTATIIMVAVFYACNCGTTVYASSAIVYRVWKTALVNNKRSRLYEVCRTVYGTGTLYSFTSFLTFLATFGAIRNTFPLSIFNSINFPTACIAYNLVIIRVGQLRADPRGTTSGIIVCNSTCPPPGVATRGVGDDSKDDSSTDLPK